MVVICEAFFCPITAKQAQNLQKALSLRHIALHDIPNETSGFKISMVVYGDVK